MSGIEVQNIKVRSLSVDFNEITWEVKSTTEDLLDYAFRVLRSEAAAGPFETISADLSDQYIFVDNDIKNGNIYRQYYYIIQVLERATGKTKDFGPTSKEPEPDLVAQELRRHLNLLFREFAGRRCWVYPVRTMGQRCSCWNEKLNKKTRSGCRTCFDTSWVRGYHRPIETWIQFDPAPKNEQPTNMGRTQQTSTTARTSYFPPIKPDDLIVEPENFRWKVRTRVSTQQGRADVTQELQVHLLPTTDIEYEIPLLLGEVQTSTGLRPITLQELYMNPSRNYTNPHTLDNDGENGVDFPKIYQLYGSQYPTVKT